MANVPLASVTPTQPQTPAAPAAPARPLPPAAQANSNQGTVQPQPATPAAPPPKAPETMKVRFRHQDLELPIEEAKKLAQIGLSAQDLERQRAEFQQQRRETEDFIKAGQLVAQLAQVDPRRFRMLQDIIAGRDPAGPQGGGDDGDGEGLTPAARAPSLSPEVELRLARMEQQINQGLQSFNQRDFQGRLDDALGKQAYLRANPEAAELAREMVPLLAQETGGNLETAAAIATARVQKIIETHLDHERRERESKREIAPVASPYGPAPALQFDKANATYGGHRSGAARALFKDALRKMQAAVSGPTQ